MQERVLRGALQSKGPLFWGPTEKFTSAWDVTHTEFRDDFREEEGAGLGFEG